jgi:hypothetical protein
LPRFGLEAAGDETTGRVRADLTCEVEDVTHPNSFGEGSGGARGRNPLDLERVGMGAAGRK